MRQVIIEQSFESDSEIKAQMRREMIAKLAKEWNCIDRQLELASFDEEANEERYHYEKEQADYYAQSSLSTFLRDNPAMTQEEQKTFLKEKRREWHDEQAKEDNKIYLQMQAIEELLSDLGARMARPYEHHGEMEGYYQYMENRGW